MTLLRGRSHRTSCSEPVRDVHRRLGDAVHVDQARTRRRRSGRTSVCSRRSSAPHRRRRRSASASRRRGPCRLPVGLGELVERRRRLVQHRDPLAHQQLAELLGRTRGVSSRRRRACRRGAAGPTVPTPRSRRRTSGTSSTRRRVRSRTALRCSSNSVDDVAVRDHDTLGATGRSRGVDDVGDVVRRQRDVDAVRVGDRTPTSPIGEPGRLLEHVDRDSPGPTQRSRSSRVGDQRRRAPASSSM